MVGIALGSKCEYWVKPRVDGSFSSRPRCCVHACNFRPRLTVLRLARDNKVRLAAMDDFRLVAILQFASRE
jgi:hypothetical protein